MPRSHTLPASLTGGTVQCIRQELASFAGCLMKVEIETKAPHARACSLTRTEQKLNTHTHTQGDILMGDSGAHCHCHEQSHICKSNRGCVDDRSCPHTNDVKYVFRYVCATHSCPGLCLLCPHTETACAFALTCQD